MTDDGQSEPAGRRPPRAGNPPGRGLRAGVRACERDNMPISTMPGAWRNTLAPWVLRVGTATSHRVSGRTRGRPAGRGAPAHLIPASTSVPPAIRTRLTAPPRGHPDGGPGAGRPPLPAGQDHRQMGRPRRAARRRGVCRPGAARGRPGPCPPVAALDRPQPARPAAGQRRARRPVPGRPGAAQGHPRPCHRVIPPGPPRPGHGTAGRPVTAPPHRCRARRAARPRPG